MTLAATTPVACGALVSRDRVLLADDAAKALLVRRSGLVQQLQFGDPIVGAVKVDDFERRPEVVSAGAEQLEDGRERRLGDTSFPAGDQSLVETAALGDLAL